MKTSLQIIRVQIYPEGTGVVITAPSKANTQGAWRLTARQLNRLAASAGCTPQQLAIVKGTLIVEGGPVKAGDTFVDRATGEVRSFTKDHFRVEELTLELPPQDKFALLAASSMAAQYMAAPAPVNAPEDASNVNSGGTPDLEAEAEKPETEEAEPAAEAAAETVAEPADGPFSDPQVLS